MLEDKGCVLETVLNIGIILIKSCKENEEASKLLNRLKTVPILILLLSQIQKLETKLNNNENDRDYEIFNKARYVCFFLLVNLICLLFFFFCFFNFLKNSFKFLLLSDESTCEELIESEVFSNLFELVEHKSIRVYVLHLISRVFEKANYSADSIKVLNYYQYFSQFVTV